MSLLRLPGLAAANAVTLVSATGLFAVWFFLTLFMQEVLGWTPLQAGAGFLPHTFAIILGTQVTTRWLADRDARVVISSALLVSTAGFVLLWMADAGTGYLLGVALPGVLVMFGAGVAFPPIIGAATAGVAPQQHGVASGVLNTTRMVGGALGLAVLADRGGVQDVARRGRRAGRRRRAGGRVPGGLPRRRRRDAARRRAGVAAACAAPVAEAGPAGRHAPPRRPGRVVASLDAHADS